MTAQSSALCDRPAIAPLDAWYELPRVLAFRNTYSGVSSQQLRISNASKYPFYVLGVAIAAGTQVPFRIKWPNGRYFSLTALTPVQSGGPVLGPVGTGGNMIGLPQMVEIPPGGRIMFENSGGIAGVLALQFWGFLRVPAGDTLAAGLAASGSALGKSGSGVSCAVGYPIGNDCVVGPPMGSGGAAGGGGSAIASQLQRISEFDGTRESTPLTPDDLQLIESLRYQCNRNVMVSEWAQGNQCDDIQPKGYTPTVFTFFSPFVTLTETAPQLANSAVILPGEVGSLICIRRIRAVSAWGSGPVLMMADPTPVNHSAVPAVAIRLPNGFSITGGDYLPLTFPDQSGGQYFPFFPRLYLKPGQRISLDWLAMLSQGTFILQTALEFDAVKWRRI